MVDDRFDSVMSRFDALKSRCIEVGTGLIAQELLAGFVDSSIGEEDGRFRQPRLGLLDLAH